ncbi:hypothetical protein CW751_03120 [Brumimicrobium salinarum]|uniref:Arginase n=1 Tax=Brumimicrobium salinarum TaxID=2058658 RepID=A0A2I0R4L7_9FLAO|nr:formimidoylglutamase [Brumimicrobium salinarum]PKR81532.1 hypothetical protein CW751_03120 [Brumimicrobium salinarum]
MEKQSSYFHFNKLDTKSIENLISKRKGETKIGECLGNASTAKYVIIGVEESIGPRANLGKKGAENGFKAFLHSFLNMQSNETLTGKSVHVLGSVSVISDEPDDLRSLVTKLDAFLLAVLKNNLKDFQIPIVIGGGHNNAFPLIQFSSMRFNTPLDVVNLDAHADYRLLEGRHSGNGFSYAFQHEYLAKYFVLGLHKRYNSQQILDDLKKDHHFFTYHEDYVMNKRSFASDLLNIKKELNKGNRPVGIELDLDAIAEMPSSAFTPIGWSIEDARRYITAMSAVNKIAYLHLPEGAPMSEKEQIIVGKTLAYLVCDFLYNCN